MDVQGYGDQLEPIYNRSVLIQDVAWKTCREQWTVGTSGERGSGKSVLAARHDDDDMRVSLNNPKLTDLTQYPYQRFSSQ